MIPHSRQTLIDYCLRNLGFPVIDINVDDDQISDRIDEAIQFYQMYHSDAIIKTWFKHSLTQEDIDNEYIYIPDSITSVTRILSMGNSVISAGMFNIQYQILLNDMNNLGFSGNLSNYFQTQSYLSTLDMILNPLPRTFFSRHSNKLYLELNWKSTVAVGDYIVVEAYRIVDPTQNEKVYNDMFLKEYATALIKRAWATNLKKFDGMQLPGGVTINGQQMYEEANQDLERLRTEIRDNWEKPVDFMIG